MWPTEVIAGEGPAVGSVQDIYRVLLRDLVAPELRAMGFKGSGSRYRLDDQEFWAVLGFQASAYNTSKAMRFTANLCVVGRSVWDSARRERPYLPESPAPNVYYGTFTWHRRIGRLMPHEADLWWDLDHATEPAVIADEVVTAIRDFGLPAMRQQLH